MDCPGTLAEERRQASRLRKKFLPSSDDPISPSLRWMGKGGEGEEWGGVLVDGGEVGLGCWGDATHPKAVRQYDDFGLRGEWLSILCVFIAGDEACEG